MKLKLSKTEAKQKIDEFFQLENFSSKDVKKIKRLAMKHKIKLGIYRRLLCKKCLSRLKGKIRITKTHKTIECERCSYKNKFKLR